MPDSHVSIRLVFGAMLVLVGCALGCSCDSAKTRYNDGAKGDAVKSGHSGMGPSHGQGVKDSQEYPATEVRMDKTAPVDTLIAPRVRDESTDLVFAYIQNGSVVRFVNRVSDVPKEVRGHVWVRASKEHGPTKARNKNALFYADLTRKNDEGSYSVNIVSPMTAKSRWAKDTVESGTPQNKSVVLYSASWCGYCKKAKAWLNENQVKYAIRDVDRDKGAADELAQKVRQKGLRAPGIPIVDWQGELVVGFRPERYVELHHSRKPTP